jgi:hypothetical protein
LNEQIAYIIDIQDIDLNIKKIEDAEAKNIYEINESAVSLKNQSEKLEELKKELSELQKKVNLCELNIESYNEKILKYTEAQKQIKTNKEYNAMQKSVKDNEALKSAEEEEIIKTMTAQEEIKSAIKTTEEDIRLLSDIILNKKAEVESDKIKYFDIKKNLTDKRNEIEKILKAEFLNVYEAIKNNNKFPAVISVNDNRACTGCFRILPPQQFNELLSGEIFMQCPICSRILYYKQEDMPEIINDKTDKKEKKDKTKASKKARVKA